MSSGSVVYTTSAHEFNQLLNDANKAYTLEIEVSAYKLAIKELKDHLAAIGKHVYESEGGYGTWSTAKDTEDSNDALKYAKQLWEDFK